MHAVRFNKQYAEAVLDAIQTGKPIPVQPGGWAGNNLLAAAGVIYAALYSQGPHRRQALGLPASLDDTHPETREAVQDTFRRELHAAIDFAGLLTFDVIDRRYDAKFEADVAAVVSAPEPGVKKLVPVSGFKAA